MLSNYFKIAWRNLVKNKSMFATNVLGLAIGLATCLIITIFVLDELSYDRFNKNADQIARVFLKGKWKDENIKEQTIMAPVAGAFKKDFPEVLDATRISIVRTNTKVIIDDQTIQKGTSAFVDPNFFELFTLPFIKGDMKTALLKPNTVVLTQAQAKTYFGDQDPINKTIRIEEIGFFSDHYINLSGLYTVTGIVDQVPVNSHFHFDLFISMLSNKDAENQRWLSGNYYTYLLLAKGTQLPGLEAKIPAFTKKYMADQVAQAFGMSYDESAKKGNNVGFSLQPLLDIHLYSDFKRGDLEAGGDIKTVYIFSAIALFMLIIACINFMNLSTAGASKRLKEIGMRKVLGSGKRQLIFQFLSESFISSCVAMLIGLGLMYLSLPLFNRLASKSLSLMSLTAPAYLISILLILIVVSLLAGGYPAFFMSAFRPIESLKRKLNTGHSKGVRSGLVVVQFTISVCLIIGTLVVSRQMNFIQHKDLGYNREQIIVLRNAGKLGNNMDVFKEELLRDPRVKSVSKSAFIPAGPTDSNQQTVASSEDPNESRRLMQYGIDENYIETMGMKLLAGRNFSQAFGNEKNNIIINETTAKIFNLGTNPVGKTLQKFSNLEGGREPLKIIGMVKDFHSRSLREPIQPLMMELMPYSGLIVKSKTNDMAGLIDNMKNEWEKFGTGEVFQYAFLDELFNETYNKESNMNTILRLFAVLTIFVACLGLFGLITFTVEQRFKEIGVRKVLGSSVIQVLGLLAKDFLKPVVISFFMAIPIGYYFTNKWLQDFEYRTNIAWWIFVLAGLTALMITLVSISYQAIKAATANPVKSLRAE